MLKITLQPAMSRMSPYRSWRYIFRSESNLNQSFKRLQLPHKHILLPATR